MRFFVDLFQMQRQQHHTNVRKEEGPGALDRAAAAARATPQPTYTYKAKKLSKKKLRKAVRKSLAGGYDASGLPQLPGQVQRPGSAYGNVNPEASSSHGPGSFGASLGQGSAPYIPTFARGPFQQMMADIAGRRHVYEYVSGSTDAQSPQEFVGTCVVPPQDCNPATYREWLTKVLAMTEAFHSTVGRYPLQGGYVTPDDEQFQISYTQLLHQYWDQNRNTASTKPLPPPAIS